MADPNALPWTPLPAWTDLPLSGYACFLSPSIIHIPEKHMNPQFSSYLFIILSCSL